MAPSWSDCCGARCATDRMPCCCWPNPAACGALDVRRPMTLAALQQESALLQRRTDADGDNADAFEFWTRLGVPDARSVPDLDADAVRALRPAALAGLANGAA